MSQGKAAQDEIFGKHPVQKQQRQIHICLGKQQHLTVLCQVEKKEGMKAFLNTFYVVTHEIY